MSGRKQLIRDFHAGQYLDLFLVSAVSAILAIRAFLHLTGYPQVGGEGLHIAHMLWGGLLMLAAIVTLLSYLGRRGHQIAAVLGGLGFGTFIDEVGKFVTNDNDYFYRPALALIYVTFILTYLAIRSIHGKQRARPEEYLVNALQEVENVAIGDLDREERDRALLYLERGDPADPLVTALRDLFDRTDLVPTPDPHPFLRVRNGAAALYRYVASRPEFPKLVIGFFVAQLTVKTAYSTSMLVWPEMSFSLVPILPPVRQAVEQLSFADWALFFSIALSGLLILFGIVCLRYSRLRAFRMFQRSILVSIFITQVFTFYQAQWAALVALGFNLSVLVTLNFVIDQESARQASRVQRAEAATLTGSLR